MFTGLGSCSCSFPRAGPRPALNDTHRPHLQEEQRTAAQVSANKKCNASLAGLTSHVLLRFGELFHGSIHLQGQDGSAGITQSDAVRSVSGAAAEFVTDLNTESTWPNFMSSGQQPASTSCFFSGGAFGYHSAWSLAFSSQLATTSTCLMLSDRSSSSTALCSPGGIAHSST